MPRRAQTKTPPKPASDILANAKNSSARPGGGGGFGAEGSGSGAVAGWESGDMAASLERPFRGGQALPGGSMARKRGFRALSFSTFGPYIGGAGSPAMEI